jgi:molecular chaperone GrpE (heat shock protein)
MRDQIVPKLPKWPFFAGDALLIGLAFFICYQGKLPLQRWEIAALVVCVGAGAILAVVPFLSEYRAAVKLVEAENLATAVAQLQNIEHVSAQISSATGLWQTAQDAADKTTKSAKLIADGMAVELKNFTEFMQKANESEKAALRLEVEKARRAESEWLQVIVRMLDHVFALNVAASRSGNPSLSKQIDGFQNACRDAARRVGLIPFIAAPAEPFNAQVHQDMEENSKPADGALVNETVASGYTFQGRLLRPAIVRLQKNGSVAEENSQAAGDSAQDQLPLESATSESV